MLIDIAITAVTLAVLIMMSVRANAAYGKFSQLLGAGRGLGVFEYWNTLLATPAVVVIVFGYLLVTAPPFTLPFAIMAPVFIGGHAFRLFLLRKKLSELQNKPT